MLERKQRLVSITSHVATSRIGPNPSWQRFRKYTFDYEDRPTFARHVLTQVRQFGRVDAAEFMPTRFSYSEAETGWHSSLNALPAIVLAITGPTSPDPMCTGAGTANRPIAS
ncbi:hypothetical protein [Croceibacterium mercuriale]|uniref:hypothetical protein n=1 Tax=Croceibacterium mercuriale TaxID=1572751 RepID=UPI0013791892|nr:hypothetical protein [Croceibacterium mercuriale]